MSITLHQIAIHEIIKSPEESEATLFLTDQVLPVDEKAELLALQLHEIYSRKNEVMTAQMASPEDELFAGYYQEMALENFSADAFIKFSRQSSQSLQLNLQGVIGAKGGYLCFVNYSVFEQAYLAIYFLRNTEGLLFQQREGQAFELDSSVYLDLDKMAMACRVAVKSGANTLLEIIKHAKSQKDISEYFLNWLGAKESVSNRDVTTTFLEAVASLSLPVDEESGEPVSPGVFREQIAKFASKSPSNTISVNAFDEQFFGEEQPLQNYIKENNVPLDTEFVYNKQTMRDFHFHKFKSKGLYLGCRHDYILSGKVSLENGKIIIDDENLFQEIMETTTAAEIS